VVLLCKAEHAGRCEKLIVDPHPRASLSILELFGQSYQKVARALILPTSECLNLLSGVSSCEELHLIQILTAAFRCKVRILK
jgi:hypothetical protein